MAEIARHAKVSKQTLYNRFATKAELVRALAHRRSEGFTTLLRRDGDAEEVLTTFAESLIASLSDPEQTRRLRMLVLMSPAAPDVALAFFEAGPLETLRHLASWLAEKDRLNVIRVPDPDHAAEMFLGMVVGDGHLKAVLGGAEFDASADRAREAVRRFMRAFAPVSTPLQLKRAPSV